MSRPELSPWWRLPLLAVLGAGLFSGLSCRQVLDPLYCSNSSDCVSDMGMPLVCAGLTHTCVPQGVGACSANQDCTNPAKPRCDGTTGQCSACIVGDNTPCPAAQPFCSQIGAATMCVACNVNTDCPFQKPICNPDHTCRQCQQHSDCGPTVNCYDLHTGTACQDSWVCIQAGDLAGAEYALVGGVCATSGISNGTQLVAYVAGGAGPPQCDNPNAQGTADSPVCKIDEALGLAQQTPTIQYIRLAPGQDYGAPTASLELGRNLIIVGAPYPGFVTPARVLVGANPIAVMGGANVTIDQTDVFLQQAGTAITCGSDSTLSIHGSIIHGSTTMTDTITAGISLANCNVLLDRNYIGVHPTLGAGPLGTAIQIVNNDGGAHNYLIEGNVIADNMGAALDLSASAASGMATIQLPFNTMINNSQSPMSPGGVICPTADMAIDLPFSIIADNPMSGTGQFVIINHCSFQQTVVGGPAPGTPIMGQIYQNPVFAASPPGSLDVSTSANRTANEACCISQVSASAIMQLMLTSPLPATDIDGTTRPQGPAYDIGAVEVPYPLPTTN